MKTTVLVSSLAIGVSIVCLAATLQASPPPASTGYADGVYADFAAASGRQVAFSLGTLETGTLKQLQGRSFGQILGTPRHLVEVDEDRLSLRNPRFKRDLHGYDGTELRGGVEGFEVAGLPLEMGRYRKLAVQTTVAGKTMRHQAIELCWEKLGHCVVYDPSIVFLDSIVNNRRLAKAAGYGPRVQYGERPASLAGKLGDTKLAACGLASNPAYISKWLTWGAWTQRYKNIYGITLVTKNLGGQQSGIRCNSSCYPAPFGYSNSSSGSGTLGYDVACGNAYNYGSSGRTGRWVAETKCAHKFTGDASATVTRNGSGSGVTLSWNTNGGVDSNGGYFTDTCGFF
ncbi:hypothetical protein [Agrilutibacter solisilvae]|uniref:Uncharacterized protein n=1 Tax=Agrilutibacter solisilvae TaxID=2763317 RepID=A0A974XXE2_9GAMM|nr:hypothetical protein [Lysobacter solisilvae]QSX77567.1 hypothetical protein I8J32_012505 [Lysobacter solisilvae]